MVWKLNKKHDLYGLEDEIAVQTDPGKSCVIIPAMVILSCAGQSSESACVCNILTDSLTVLD